MAPTLLNPWRLVLVLAPVVAVASDICTTLSAQLPGRVYMPDSTGYDNSQNAYYCTQERDMTPSCVVRPTNTSDVALFMKLVNPNNDAASASKFAVRSGGHSLFAGAANINDGVTLDMRGINEVVISDDRQMISLGGGAIFSDVYTQLVPHNLTILGGRFPGIGAGGFITGGGINFLSRKHGFSCDNVYGYEAVLGDGSVVYASAGQNSDLWMALKGGSFNFGIITRFDVAAFELGNMWGGLVSYNYSSDVVDAEIDALVAFMDPENYDELAVANIQFSWTNIGTDASEGTLGLANGLFYSAPVADPPVYQQFLDIPSVGNTLATTDIGTIVKSLGSITTTTSDRNFELSYTFKNTDAATFKKLITSWEQSTTLLQNVTQSQQLFLLQALPVTNGTNMLGIQAGETDIVLATIDTIYLDASDDSTVTTVITNLVNEHMSILSEKGLLMDYLYLNYADVTQDVFSSYGSANKKALQAAAKKYDPTGVFQTAAPGGFKLSQSM